MKEKCYGVMANYNDETSRCIGYVATEKDAIEAVEIIKENAKFSPELYVASNYSYQECERTNETICYASGGSLATAYDDELYILFQ